MPVGPVQSHLPGTLAECVQRRGDPIQGRRHQDQDQERGHDNEDEFGLPEFVAIGDHGAVAVMFQTVQQRFDVADFDLDALSDPLDSRNLDDAKDRQIDRIQLHEKQVGPNQPLAQFRHDLGRGWCLEALARDVRLDIQGVQEQIGFLPEPVRAGLDKALNVGFHLLHLILHPVGQTSEIT